MEKAEPREYLKEIINILKTHWPDNRTVNIVCHGHSVPAGYFATPMVNTFNSYPHLVHRELNERFPFAVINMIVSAVGAEDSVTGKKRFESETLCQLTYLLRVTFKVIVRA